MKASNLGVVPLQKASLCLDCEMITEAQTDCLACGSAALLNVSRALNRSASMSLIPRRPLSFGEGIFKEASAKCARRLFALGSEKSSRDRFGFNRVSGE